MESAVSVKVVLKPGAVARRRLPFLRTAALVTLVLVVGVEAGTAALRIIAVDLHDRLFPDRPPSPAASTRISVPRGAPAVFQFALTSDKAGAATVAVSTIARESLGGNFPGEARVHFLLPVHVEGNTQGSKINRPGGPVPEGWMQQLVRAAPFDTLEVLADSEPLNLAAGKTHGLLVEVAVPATAAPGNYSGSITVSSGGESASAPLHFSVHETVLPEAQSLHSVHWLWPEPCNLTRDNVPAWWSERHWTLLENSGRQLRRFGDDTLYTPLVNYREPLIQISAREDGGHEFDYARFNRWVETFRKLGYRHFAGHHILNLPLNHAGGVFVLDGKTGHRRVLFSPAQREEWLGFLPTFYASLQAHLAAKGWTNLFLLHQYDEPRDAALYQRLAALAREDLPGVRTIDAINSSRQDVFSPLVDVQVFNLVGLNRYQALVEERARAGRDSWLYHCTSPYPPHPNRHLDCSLTESRLYPWLCFKLGAQGYLFWGANIYRGADEYKTSIGPFPNGSQNPGHPPGDNWFFYRGPDGLRPSMRMVSFREGVIDYELLTLLAKHAPERAQAFAQRVVRTITDFERQPAVYHQVRADLLAVLEDSEAGK